MKKLGIIVVLFFMCKYIECDIVQEPQSTCVDLKPQNNFDVDKIVGIWYANERIEHSEGVHDVLPPGACVEFVFADITNSVHRMYDPSQKPGYRYLRLIWNAFENILLYNNTHRGLWIAKTTPQPVNATKEHPRLFTGVIQVMKVVGNHMVLNFCENEGTLFSMALARSPDTYTPQDLASVHTLLKRKGLSSYSSQRLCSGSTMHNISIVTLFIALFACVFKHF